MINAYASWKHATVGILGSGLTIAMVWGLCASYQDSLFGPTWLMALVCYVPFFFATFYNIRSKTQIYGGTFACLLGIWMIIPHMVGISVMYGIPFIIGFWILVAGCLHLWSIVLGGRVSMRLVLRVLSMFMTIGFVVTSVYGVLISVGIQFYRVPFLLQPISVFGFPALEAFILFVNGLLGYIAYEWISGNKSSLLKFNRRNPLLYLVSTITGWCLISGIIWGSASPVATMSVATANKFSLQQYMQEPYAPYYDRADYINLVTDIARSIPQLAKKLSSESEPIGMMVFPEFFIVEYNETDLNCERVVTDLIAPHTLGMKAIIVMGCFSYNGRNMALTFDTESGELLNVYGKMRPTPGENSNDRRGFFTMPIPSTMSKWTPGTEAHPLFFSPLICYDVDYTDTVSKSADLGASLIANPSHDWQAVRHHFAASVVRAVENRVAIIKAEENIDAAIISPYGEILAFGSQGDRNAMHVPALPITTPLTLNYGRQIFMSAVFMASLAVFLAYDIYTLIRRRREAKKAVNI